MMRNLREQLTAPTLGMMLTNITLKHILPKVLRPPLQNVFTEQNKISYPVSSHSLIPLHPHQPQIAFRFYGFTSENISYMVSFVLQEFCLNKKFNKIKHIV